MFHICYSLATILTAIFLSSCSSQSRYTMLVPTHLSKPSNCDVEVFRTGQPTKQFVRISRIDVHIERTYFIRTNFDDVLPKLKKEACESGADAIIEIQELSTNINLDETNIFHITAIGIKYQQ